MRRLEDCNSEQRMYALSLKQLPAAPDRWEYGRGLVFGFLWGCALTACLWFSGWVR